MAKVVITKSKLDSLAQHINAKAGTTGAKTIAQMQAAVDGITGGDDGSFKAVIERTAVNPTLPGDLTTIGYSAFSGCPKLALTSLPPGITNIGSYVFQSCPKLALTSLPHGITRIGYYAFNGCRNLAITSIPPGITDIGFGVFANCTGLTSITFEGNPNTIHPSAFNGCSNLTTINVPWAEGAVANAPWGATNATINYNYTGG